MSSKLIYADESYKIQGAIFDVYRELGCGFLESVYQEALEIELRYQGIPVEPQREITIAYRGVQLRSSFRADFICYGKIILEIKAVDKITNSHKAQVLNYLHATKMKLALLVNFGAHPVATVTRIVL